LDIGVKIEINSIFIAREAAYWTYWGDCGEILSVTTGPWQRRWTHNGTLYANAQGNQPTGGKFENMHLAAGHSFASFDGVDV